MVDNMDIHVIAMRQDPSERIARCDNVTVHRVWWWTMVTGEKLRSWRKTFPLVFVVGLINKAVSKLCRDVLKSDFLDLITVHNIYRELVKIAGEKFDVIIPVAGHYETVKAALDFTRRHQTNAIVYQLDPCASNAGYSMETANARKKFECEMCERADAIITTPILLKEMQGNLADNLQGKITAMEFPNIGGSKELETNKVNVKPVRYSCVFAGAIYRQARNPAYTFRMFSALKGKEIYLQMVGVDRHTTIAFCEQEALPDNIDCCGTVPLEQAQQYMEDADVLVNIGNIMTNQVPSKIFEYISSGKPIVNICTSHECPTLPYLEKYPYVLNLFECDPDFDEQVKKLETFIKENAGKRVSADYIMKTYETCTAQYCAKQMLDIIRKVSEH